MPALTQTALMERIEAFALPDEARMWMHTANRLLTDEECGAVERHLASFVSSWAAHGTPLKAEFGIMLNQVVVLAVDETRQVATGCSIDASVAALRAVNGLLPSLEDLDLFDRDGSCMHLHNWTRPGKQPNFMISGPCARQASFATSLFCWIRPSRPSAI